MKRLTLPVHGSISVHDEVAELVAHGVLRLVAPEQLRSILIDAHVSGAAVTKFHGRRGHTRVIAPYFDPSRTAHISLGSNSSECTEIEAHAGSPFALKVSLITTQDLQGSRPVFDAATIYVVFPASDGPSRDPYSNDAFHNYYANEYGRDRAALLLASLVSDGTLDTLKLIDLHPSSLFPFSVEVLAALKYEFDGSLAGSVELQFHEVHSIHGGAVSDIFPGAYVLSRWLCDEPSHGRIPESMRTRFFLHDQEWPEEGDLGDLWDSGKIPWVTTEYTDDEEVKRLFIARTNHVWSVRKSIEADMAEMDEVMKRGEIEHPGEKSHIPMVIVRENRATHFSVNEHIVPPLMEQMAYELTRLESKFASESLDYRVQSRWHFIDTQVVKYIAEGIEAEQSVCASEAAQRISYWFRRALLGRGITLGGRLDRALEQCWDLAFMRSHEKGS